MLLSLCFWTHLFFLVGTQHHMEDPDLMCMLPPEAGTPSIQSIASVLVLHLYLLKAVPAFGEASYMVLGSMRTPFLRSGSR